MSKAYRGIERVQQKIDERLTKAIALSTVVFLLGIILVYVLFFNKNASSSISLIVALLIIGVSVFLIFNLIQVNKLKPFAANRNAVEVAFQGIYYLDEKFEVSAICTLLDLHLKKEAVLSWYMPSNQGADLLLCRVPCSVKKSLATSDGEPATYLVEGFIPENAPSTESEAFRVYAQLRLKTALADYDFHMHIGLDRESWVCLQK